MVQLSPVAYCGHKMNNILKSDASNYLPKKFIFRDLLFSEEPTSLIAIKEVGAVDAKHLRMHTLFWLV